LAQQNISIRIVRMAMVIGTIGEAGLNFMCVILGQRGGFVNGASKKLVIDLQSARLLIVLN
jgi:hypothetical protein